MADPSVLYMFTRSERGIFVEIYFPKKVVYQGAVFQALERGLDPAKVRKYLNENIPILLQELKSYIGFFDPHQYESDQKRKTQPTTQEAIQRINMYESHFRGWSMDEVDGVWMGEKGELVEERTQLIRIIFRLPTSHAKEAEDAGCLDVLRSITFWCIQGQGNLNEHVEWGKAEEKRFIVRHRPWPKQKLSFARKYFKPVAKEVAKWRDDCALFVFGYLVKKFAANVLVKGTKEQVIDTTSQNWT